MRGWFNDWLKRLGPKASAVELRDILVAAIGEAGFDCIACGELDLDEPKRSVFFLNTWPAAYFELYRREGAVEFDPLLRRVRESSEPFSWTDLPIRNQRENWLWKSALGFGWHDGLAVPIPRGGGRFGLISLASCNPVPSGEDRNLVVGFVTTAYERLRGVVDGQEFVVNNAGLTPREIECLGLVAAGLSDAAVAARLGIVKDTAHEHIERGKRKLGARTRPQAVALAMAMSLLRR